MMYPLIAARLSSMAVLLINLRCECLILDIRSKRLIALCAALGFITSELARATNVPGIVTLLVINPLFTIAAPLALSQGPLHIRLGRIFVVNLASMLSEVVCTICYLNLEGVPVYTVVTAANFPHIIASYMTGSIVHVLLTELVILRLRDSDPSWEVHIELPILAFVVGSYLFLSFGIFRYGAAESENPFIPLLFLVATALSIVVSFALHHIVRDETTRTREAADRAVTLRQTRHVRRQIEDSALRVMHLRRLRHDLANQIGVVVELARTDHLEEADRYLAELLERSCDLKEDAHE